MCAAGLILTVPPCGPISTLLTLQKTVLLVGTIRPSVDGIILPDQPLLLVQKGYFARVPVPPSLCAVIICTISIPPCRSNQLNSKQRHIDLQAIYAHSLPPSFV